MYMFTSSRLCSHSYIVRPFRCLLANVNGVTLEPYPHVGKAYVEVQISQT